MINSSLDHYEALGVSPNATSGEIEEAFRRLASQYEAERDESTDARDRFQQVRSAYNVLSDPQTRALYDMRLEARSAGQRQVAREAPVRPGSGAGVALKPWGIPAILAALAIPLLLWGANFAAKPPTELSDSEVIVGIILNVFILDGLFVAVPVMFCFWRYRLDWGALGFRPFPRDASWVPIAAAVTALAATIVYLGVLRAFDLTPKQQTDDLFNSRVVLPFAGVATVIVAPLAEEIFFRGFIFSGLLRPLGLVGAMAVSGLLFATVHVTDSSSALIVPLFAAIGFGFAWLYYRTGSLWTTIATHTIFNLVGFAIGAAHSGG